MGKIYASAIVGCGRIGCFLDSDAKRKGTLWTHAAAYKACSRTQLVALIDVDEKARIRAAKRWKVHDTYPSLEMMLRHKDIDILSICTQSDSHAELFKQAVKAGIPAIWCEKPMATTLRDTREMIRSAQKKIVAVNHTRRWDRPYEITREWIEGGHVGNPIAVTAYYTHGISNIGSHLFDTLRFLLGDIEWVMATGFNSKDIDPTLSGLVKFINGAGGHIVGCKRGMLLYEIDIIGDHGRVKISENGWRVEAWSLIKSSRYSGYDEYGPAKLLWKGADKYRMLKALNDIVHGLDHRTIPRCSSQDGMKAVELVAAFFHSSKTGHRVNLPVNTSLEQMRIPTR